MPADVFQIEFSYDHTSYIGIVTPVKQGNETVYSVQLESENQESNITIVATPSASMIEGWEFECEDEGDPLDYYDQALLQEIGEAIEAHLSEVEAGAGGSDL